MAQKSYLIDAHHHPMPPFYKALLDELDVHFIQGGTPIRSWKPEDSLAMMDKNGVSASVFNMPAWGVYSRTIAMKNNEYWATVVRDYPGKFAATGFLYYPDVEGALKEVEHSLDVLKLDGVCVLTNHGEHYLADPEYDELLAELNRRKAIVSVHANVQPGPALGKVVIAKDRPAGFHVGPVELWLNCERFIQQLWLGGVLERYPGIRWFFPHNARDIPMLSEGRGAFGGRLELLKKQYYLISSGTAPLAMSAMRDFVDPTHIMWGSDFGIGADNAAQIATTTAGIKQMREYDGFDEKARALYEHGNAVAFFPTLKKYFK